MSSPIQIGALPALADGTSTPIVLNDVTLTASTTYRAVMRVDLRDRAVLAWRQRAGGAGSLAITIRGSAEQHPPYDAADADIWQDLSASYAFAGAPAGAAGCEILPFTYTGVIWLLAELVVAGADCTRFSLYGGVR